MKQTRSILASLVVLSLLVGMAFVWTGASFANVLELTDAESNAAGQESFDVEYIDEYCVPCLAQYCTSIDANTTELNEGWYVVRENVELKTALTIEGNVFVVLQNGCTLTASKGIEAKKDAKLSVYGQQDATGKLVVHKGIKLKLTAEQKAEAREALACELELNPNYKAPEPQILCVQPCLRVVAGDRAPKPEDSEPPVDEVAAKERESHAPREVAAPKLNQELLAKNYLVICPITQHALRMDGDFLVVEDDHFTCTVCDGWFEDEDCHYIILKPEPNPEFDAVAESQLALEQESEQESSDGATSENGSSALGSTTSSDAEDASGTGSDKMVTVTFDANGGSGTMAPMEVEVGKSFVLPECTFDPPEGMEFSTWSLGKPGSSVSVPTSITVKAWWKQASSSGGGDDSGGSGSGGQSSSGSDSGNTDSQTTDGSSSTGSGDATSGSTSTDANTSSTTSGSSSQSSTASKHPATGDGTAPYGIALACVLVGATLVLVGKVQGKH